MITSAAGTPFQDYVTQEILRPLGMDRTGFSLNPAAEAAVGYVRAPGLLHRPLQAVLPAGVVGPRHGNRTALQPFYVDGAAYGGLVGDVQDVGRFLRLHLHDGELGGYRVLDVDTARWMRQLDHPGKPFEHATG